MIGYVKVKIRLEDVYLSIETTTVPEGQLMHCTTSLKRKDSRGLRKKERKYDYNDEAIVLLNHLKLLMSLWRALISALDTEFKPSKKPQHQLTKGWAITGKVLDSLQLLFIVTYPVIARLGSVPDPRR